jgi:hypothetical protein
MVTALDPVARSAYLALMTGISEPASSPIDAETAEELMQAKGV